MKAGSRRAVIESETPDLSIIKRLFKGHSYVRVELFHNKSCELIVFIILRISFITGMFPISYYSETLSCLMSEDLELLQGIFWKTQAAFNEMNIKVVKVIYFDGQNVDVQS